MSYRSPMVSAGGRGGLGSGGRGRRSSYKHRRRSRRRGSWARTAVVVLVVLVVVVVAAGVRVVTEGTPALRASTVLASPINVPGTPPAPAWPATGQAAFVVPGVVREAGPHQVPSQIASMAKVMTAYVVLADHPVAAGGTGFTYTVTAADVADYSARLAQAESVVSVVAGEQLDEVQLLQGLLVASGNNYADILADVDAGSPAAFVARMNAAARRLGMTYTTYTDPSGFAPTTLSTARDQAILAAAAMAQPAIASTVSARSVTLPDAGTVDNYDTLIGTDGFVGVKTGSDAAAGGCFMFAVRRRVGATQVAVYGAVLGQDVGTQVTTALITAAQTASRRLVDSVTPALAERTVLAAGTPVVRVTDARGHVVEAVTATNLQAIVWPGSSIPIGIDTPPVGTSVTAGQVLATITGIGLHTTAKATTSSQSPTLGYKIRHLL